MNHHKKRFQHNKKWKYWQHFWKNIQVLFWNFCQSLNEKSVIAQKLKSLMPFLSWLYSCLYACVTADIAIGILKNPNTVMFGTSPCSRK